MTSTSQAHQYDNDTSMNLLCGEVEAMELQEDVPSLENLEARFHEMRAALQSLQGHIPTQSPADEEVANALLQTLQREGIAATRSLHKRFVAEKQSGIEVELAKVQRANDSILTILEKEPLDGDKQSSVARRNEMSRLMAQYVALAGGSNLHSKRALASSQLPPRLEDNPGLRNPKTVRRQGPTTPAEGPIIDELTASTPEPILGGEDRRASTRQGASSAKAPTTLRKTAGNAMQTMRRLLNIGERKGRVVQTVQQIMAQCDMYETAAPNQRRDAGQASAAEFEAISKQLDVFTTEEGKEALSGFLTKGGRTCARARYAKVGGFKNDNNNTDDDNVTIEQCAYCKPRGCVCVMRLRTQRPLLIPPGISEHPQILANDVEPWKRLEQYSG
ncbi:hypothetical protein LTR86_003083 [Recurvomyces mirabilis]|nr:hypothetical protein LTR86_003083 [Recurvomyces mirabilis]